jgi:hypothetical protein
VAAHRLRPSRCLFRLDPLRFSSWGEKKGFVCDRDEKRKKRSQIK